MIVRGRGRFLLSVLCPGHLESSNYVCFTFFLGGDIWCINFIMYSCVELLCTFLLSLFWIYDNFFLILFIGTFFSV